MLNVKDCNAVYKTLKMGANDLVTYLNDGGFVAEGVFSAANSRFKLFREFSDFGDSTEISKRLSPILEKGLAYCASVHLKALGLCLRQEDGVGYDYVLETLDGDLIDYIELKITTRKQKDRIDLWTLNKNSQVKVPLHLLIGYKTKGNKISEIGVYLVNKDEGNAVYKFIPRGNNHSYAQLRLMPDAMISDYFVCIIGGLSRRSLTGRARQYDRPYALMERF